MIKSPKIYFYDTGLACSLLKLQNAGMVKTHYLYGTLYENFVIAEIMKVQYHAGKIPSVYYWRESNGTEIDCIIEDSNQKIIAVEIKGGETFNKEYLKNLKNFPADNDKITKNLIYAGEDSSMVTDIHIIGHPGLQKFLHTLI